VVYAPHVYTGGFSGGPITRRAFEIAIEEARRFGGAPVLSGEWGADPRRAGKDGDGYFLAHQGFQDELHVGATLWTWRESCGDPHKIADLRAGARPPYPWGEFDVDCNTNEVIGERAPLIQDLTRAYPRAAPGRLRLTHYEPRTGTLSVAGGEAAAGAELVVFYPAGKHGVPRVSGEGLGQISFGEAPGGSLLLRARAVGGDWSLAASPE
jgi:endoglycosylceramidase